MRSLCRLVQAQEDFGASVRDMLDGLDGLWAQLEVLHTGVTLNKQGSRGCNDLASARTDAEVSRCVGPSAVLWYWFYSIIIIIALPLPLSVVCNTLMCLAKTLSAVLGHYRNRLQCCQAHQEDSTQVLQVKFSSCSKKAT